MVINVVVSLHVALKEVKHRSIKSFQKLDLIMSSKILPLPA
jgi:hypothetical protein